jgi:hypothetical protein
LGTVYSDTDSGTTFGKVVLVFWTMPGKLSISGIGFVFHFHYLRIRDLYLITLKQAHRITEYAGAAARQWLTAGNLLPMNETNVCEWCDRV